MARQLNPSSGPREPLAGGSRAVRTGNQVFVAGTTAARPDGTIEGAGDAYLQAKRCLEIVAAALAEAGAEMRHVVRTRMFVTDMSRWEEFGRAHGEVFGETRPAATMVQVAALITPGMLIEIEADAVIDS